VLVDIDAFLKDPSQPLPSGADIDAVERLKTAKK